MTIPGSLPIGLSSQFLRTYRGVTSAGAPLARDLTPTGFHLLRFGPLALPLRRQFFAGSGAEIHQYGLARLNLHETLLIESATVVGPTGDGSCVMGDSDK